MRTQTRTRDAGRGLGQPDRSTPGANLVLLPPMNPEPDQRDYDASERQRLATDLAWKRGREAGRIDGILEQHEQRLNAINGSVAKTASRLEAMAVAVNKMENAQETRDKIHEALANAVKAAGDKQVTTRQFAFGLIGAVTAISTVLLAVLS